MKWILAVTGASGCIYTLKVARYLNEHKIDFDLIISRTGQLVMDHEMTGSREKLEAMAHNVYDDSAIFEPPASGSVDYAGMIVVPCSMSTVGKIASSIADTLISRAAAVTLKEKRPLVLVPRETPLSLTMLDSLRSCALAGASIVPAMPSFYSSPKSIDDLASQMAGRILKAAGIVNDLYQRWGD